MSEAQHIPTVTQLAAIQIALQFFKEQIPPNLWERTPLPVIAAPRSWMDDVAKFMGAAEGEVPAEVYGCSVIEKPELDQPVLITHDGKAYRVNDFVDTAAAAKAENIMERYRGTLATLAKH